MMASPKPPSSNEYVKKFQVMDSVASVLSMILDGRDSGLVSSAIAKVYAKFQECEQFLDTLPGGDMSKVEQKRKIEDLKASIARRKALVAKYANMDVLQKIAIQPSPLPSPGFPPQGSMGVDVIMQSF